MIEQNRYLWFNSDILQQMSEWERTTLQPLFCKSLANESQKNKGHRI